MVFNKKDDGGTGAVTVSTLTFDPGEFGIYADAELVVDPDTRLVTATIKLGRNVIRKTIMPVPLAVAWMDDNASGKCLAEAGKLKV